MQKIPASVTADGKTYTAFTDPEGTEPDAAVFAKSDLTINGKGSLQVTGQYENGIRSKDTLCIAGGDLQVTAVNHGLKGKDAVFHVKLHAITREELPELDDDFASEVSDFDTMAEYRADVEKKLQEAAAAQADEAARNALIEKVVENAEVDIPDPMVEDKLNDMMQEMGWRMQQQGFSMEMSLKMLGQTEAQMRAMYRAEARKNVKTELVLDEIIKAESVEADEADVDKLLESYASSMNQTLDQLKEQVNAEQMDYFKHRAQVTKALDMIWDNAKVTEESAEA